ncbi:unnamed protein product [Penicillium salamii]|uniref:DNA polymerase n=1 Tax=Penicillium salamii TaxID=1612424 RepID=A0A9W4JEX8_9EURO|nr:unnamed protein product [Penicillium salamii]
MPVDIFSSQPPIFVLPTHLSLEALDEVEGQLLECGGNLTYDIAEARLVLGKVSRAKRAALELRSRGIWTEEYAPPPASAPRTHTSTTQPTKRRRTTLSTEIKNVPTEVIDLSTESESEEDGVRSCHDPSKHLVKENPPDDLITVLKLEWLEESIRAGRSLPTTPFVVYRGHRIPAPTTTKAEKIQLDQKPNQIIQRAKQDASQPSPIFSSQVNKRRSKEPVDSSQRPIPILHRQTTSENDESNPLPPQPDWVRDQVLLACMRSTPLHPPNEEFISQLIKIRRIRELTLDQIGVRAYSTSIASLASYPYLIRRPSEILALPGCDVKIANLFTQYHEDGGCRHTDDDGNIAAANALDSDPVLRILNSFYDIWGVGAKTARDFYNHRGWRHLDDIVEHRWSTLSRVQQIGLKFYEEFQQGISRAEARYIAAIIQDHANRVRPECGGVECIIVGGYRRGKEMAGDVDIILTHRDESVTRNIVVDIVASLEKEMYITHTLSLHLTSSMREQQTLPYHGDETGRGFDTLDKALVVWQDPNFIPNPVDDINSHGKKNPNIHRRVDIIVSPWRTVGCAVLGWTGDTTFQRDLRRHAKKAHSWKFDSSGVRDQNSGQVLDLESGGETWEERERLVMERLGVGWRPPEERCTR